MSNIMVVDSSKKVRSNCFVITVLENYYCFAEDKVFPQIHLIFKSENDYDKIKEINRMIKNYFKLEKKYLKSEKKLVLFYLKEMKRYMEDCEVMEVLSNHKKACYEEFCCIRRFINSDGMLLSLQRKELEIANIDEELIEKMLKRQ